MTQTSPLVLKNIICLFLAPFLVTCGFMFMIGLEYPGLILLLYLTIFSSLFICQAGRRKGAPLCTYCGYYAFGLCDPNEIIDCLKTRLIASTSW